jgi:hypothetical protein
MKISKVQQVVSGLNRSWGRPCLFVAAFLLDGVGEATVATVQGGEEDDIKALRQLENDIAQAWVQRDTQTLDRILAGDYTFAGAGDVLIDKEQWVAGVDYPGIRTTSAIVDDLRIRGKASIRNQSLGGAEHARSVSDRREISPSREPLLRDQGCRARVPRRKVLRMTKPLCQFVERLWNRCSPMPVIIRPNS